MDLDSALSKLGIWGFFPLVTFLIICWGAFITPLYILYPSFLTFTPRVHNVSASGAACNFSADDGVNNADYQTTPRFCPGNTSFYCVDDRDRMQVHSLAIRWNLVCQDSYLVPLLKSFIFVGYLLGCTYIGPIMDRFGRKRLTVISHVLTGVFGIVVAFADNVILYLFLRILIGACTLVGYMGNYIIVCEMVPKRLRGPFAMAVTVPWATATALLPALAYLLPLARDLTLALAIPNFLFAVLIYFFVPESLTWLLNNGRRLELEEFLVKEGKKRSPKLEFEPGFLADEEFEINQKKLESQSKSLGCLSILRSKMYLKFTILLCLVWNIDAAFYHGLNFSSATGKNPYITFCLNGISELIGYLAAMAITGFCTRKRPTVLLHVLAGIFVCLIPLCRAVADEDNVHVANFIIALNLMSKFCITITFVLAWLYAGEVVHTNLRSSVFAVCEFMSRVGSFLAPFLVYLGEQTISAAPEILVGLLSMLAALLVLPLPETAKHALPNTKDDVRAMMRGGDKGEKEEKEEENANEI